jgi:hypothetical protein
MTKFPDIDIGTAPFQPKEGGEPWTISLHNVSANGYDFALFLDRKDTWTSDSGYMLEFGIQADGKLCAQLTAHPGHDALATLECDQHTLTVTDTWGGPVHVISDGPEVIENAGVHQADAALCHRAGHPAHAALLDLVRSVVEAAREIDDRIDDRANGGRDAVPPDGDTYNELWDALGPLFALFPREEV